jgi:hypothetical protein
MCTGETPNAVRRAGTPLIPDGGNSVQQYLEASIILAWAEATWLRRTFGRETPSFVAVTHPATDGLTIGVPDLDHLVPLLGRILPINTAGVVTGIPGLRARIGRDHLDLVLELGYSVQAKVRFLGATRQRFGTLLHENSGQHPDQRPLVFDKHVDRHEGPLFAGFGISSAAFLSGILRRISLWRTASELYLGTYRQRVAVMWFGDPPAGVLAAILGRSACAVSRAVVAPAFSARVGDTGFQEFVQHIEIAPGPDVPLADSADSTDAWDAMRAVRAASSGRAGPSPCLADNVVSSLMWGPPDLDRAFEEQRFTAVYRLARRIGVSEAEIAATTGQSPSAVAAVLRGGDVTSRDVAERIAERLDLPRGWL